MSDRRLLEMGIDPDGDPGEIMREVARRYKTIRARLDTLEAEAAADTSAIVDNRPMPCECA